MTHSSRIALVTGANRGIGRATALQLARDGADIIVTYNSHREEADAVVGEISALGRSAVALQLDVAKTSAFGSFAAAVHEVLRSRWNRETFDFLVNNGGLQVASRSRR
ncbi:NAD(P)-dependent dehydrogenase (short-subunit alcohol dehydrogenase family) [Variovorax paradoxus]|nr:NAD(P)-dependent dehydrogenase (short-subunit alcohol dehydrogenase family) [Variovorax paradoxus]